MAGIKPTDFSSITPTGTTEVYTQTDGVNGKFTLEDIKAYIEANLSPEWTETTVELTDTEILTLGSSPVQILPDITDIPEGYLAYYNIDKITVTHYAALSGTFSGLTDDNYLAFIMNTAYFAFDRAMLSNPSTSGWVTEIANPTFNRNYSTNEKNRNPAYVRKMNYNDGLAQVLNNTGMTLRIVKTTSPFYTDPSGFSGFPGAVKMTIKVKYKIETVLAPTLVL